MRFKCGPTIEEKIAIQKEKEDARRWLTKWHKVFAWLPVEIEPGHCIWLEWVERRYDDHVLRWGTSICEVFYRELTKEE